MPNSELVMRPYLRALILEIHGDPLYILSNFTDQYDWRLEPNPPLFKRDPLLSYFMASSIPPEPVTFDLKGRRSRDVVTYGFNYFISSKVVRLLESERISGWSTYPVGIVNKKRPDVTFRGLSVTGRFTRSLGGWDPTVGVTVGFDKDSWDRSDIFISSRGEGHIFGTDRVRDVFKRDVITGIHFYPIDPAGTVLDMKREFEKLRRNRN